MSQSFGENYVSMKSFERLTNTGDKIFLQKFRAGVVYSVFVYLGRFQKRWRIVIFLYISVQCQWQIQGLSLCIAEMALVGFEVRNQNIVFCEISKAAVCADSIFCECTVCKCTLYQCSGERLHVCLELGESTWTSNNLWLLWAKVYFFNQQLTRTSKMETSFSGNVLKNSLVSEDIRLTFPQAQVKYAKNAKRT